MSPQIASSLHSINVIEGDTDASSQDEIRALQQLINSGTVWSLQGSYGRAAMDALQAGVCALGEQPSRDYWGNRIPSRFEVKSGTKGSVQYVQDRGNEVLE